MTSIYVVIVRMNGGSGNIIEFIDSAYTNEEAASKKCHDITELYMDDPNFIAYVTGPITVNE